MKKLTDDDANELLAVIATDFIRPEEIKKTWRECGLLESDETPLEKAREAHGTFQHELGRGYEVKRIAIVELAEHDAYEQAVAERGKKIEELEIVSGRYGDVIVALKAELNRLKASVWTDDMIDEYTTYCFGRETEMLSPSEWLAKRRAGKGAE